MRWLIDASDFNQRLHTATWMSKEPSITKQLLKFTKKHTLGKKTDVLTGDKAFLNTDQFVGNMYASAQIVPKYNVFREILAVFKCSI